MNSRAERRLLAAGTVLACLLPVCASAGVSIVSSVTASPSSRVAPGTSRVPQTYTIAPLAGAPSMVTLPVTSTIGSSRTSPIKT